VVTISILCCAKVNEMDAVAVDGVCCSPASVVDLKCCFIEVPHHLK
jgi:hypothetical protein